MAGKTTVVKRSAKKVKAPAKATATATKKNSSAGGTKSSGAGTRTGAMDRLRKDVHKIAKSLKGGAKMKDVRAEYGFGSGGPIRSELAKEGYDSKGGQIELPTLPKGGNALAKALVKQREAGVPWYTLEIATGKSEADLREIVEEEGGPTGRVYRSNGENGDKPAKKASSKGSGEKAPANKGGVKRGRG